VSSLDISISEGESAMLFHNAGHQSPSNAATSRLTGTLSCCLNWTDERIAIPVPPTFTYVQSLNDGDASLGDFVIV